MRTLNLYVDSSAVVKAFVAEPGSNQARAAITEASRQFACRIGFVETMRALRLTAEPRVSDDASDYWRRVEIIELDEHVCQRAVELAAAHNLRSMDAIHLAAALRTPVDGLTLATWDRRLHAAARAEGLSVVPATLD